MIAVGWHDFSAHPTARTCTCCQRAAVDASLPTACVLFTHSGALILQSKHSSHIGGCHSNKQFSFFRKLESWRMPAERCRELNKHFSDMHLTPNCCCQLLRGHCQLHACCRHKRVACSSGHGHASWSKAVLPVGDRLETDVEASLMLCSKCIREAASSVLYLDGTEHAVALQL